MANRLDPTWAHLPAPAPTHAGHAAASHYYSSPIWLSPAAAFENEALTSALRASMAPATTAAAASSYPTTPSSSSTSSASDLLSGGHDAAASTPASSRPAPPSARFRSPLRLPDPRCPIRIHRFRSPLSSSRTTSLEADIDEPNTLAVAGGLASWPLTSDRISLRRRAPSPPGAKPPPLASQPAHFPSTMKVPILRRKNAWAPQWMSLPRRQSARAPLLVLELECQTTS